MLVLNFTGLRRWYVMPAFRHQSNHNGLWYTSIRWIGIEVIFYSREMGAEFIRRFNRQSEDAKGGAV